MVWHTNDDLAQAVALEVLLHGPLARADLARRLDLAPATLTRISTELLEAGLFVEAPQFAERRAGRPSIPLQVVADAHHFLGVKLARTTLTAAVTNLHADVLEYVEEPLLSTAPDAVAQQIARIEQQLGTAHRIDAIGIGLGGVVTDDGVVLSAPFLEWTDVALAQLVSDATGIPAYAANDLTAFTESEHWFGLGADRQNFATLTLGAGVGYGCVANGRLLANQDSGVGLVGHWPLDPLGPLCGKGHRGCAEALLSTPSILRDLAAAVGHPVTWEEFLERVERRDDAATRIAESSGRALGALIAAIANLTAPEVVILGGEGVALAAVAMPSVKAGIAAHRDPRASEVPIALTSGSNESWCRGAAVIALQRFVTDHRRAAAGSGG